MAEKEKDRLQIEQYVYQNPDFLRKRPDVARESASEDVNPLALQVGGSHYKKFKIQPIEFCQINELNQCESNVIKYICRWRDKGGLEDLLKAKHMIDLIIEIEKLK